MKILKLLPVMLLLNCITICETSLAENILLYTASNPTFFNTDLDDLKYDVEEKINAPLTEDEKDAFNNKHFSYEEDDENSRFTEFCKKRNSHSLRNLIDEYKSFADSEDSSKWDLSDYIPMRINFLSKFFLKKFLEINEILIPVDQIQGNESELFEDQEKIKTSLKAKGYDDKKIEKIFFLMNFLAERFNEFMPGYYPIRDYRNIISWALAYDLE